MALTYEEARDVIFDIFSGREAANPFPQQWLSLLGAVQTTLDRRAGRDPQPIARGLPAADVEIVREAFWDMFRQGYIIPGINDSNPDWPFFKVSIAGRRLIETGQPWRFHDSTTYLEMVRTAMPDVSDITVEYLAESVSSFYAGNLLAASVMLGVGAEAEFLRLVDVAAQHPSHGHRFNAARKQKVISEAIRSFRNALSPIESQLPRHVTEDLAAHFDTIQGVIRVARNQAGHPTAGRPTREQVYVYLQLFAPFAQKIFALRRALT
ncbi:MAG: hypothetical protein Q7V31_08025 [Parvibaculum sp.]|uniref:hypothetical protein n=1 Tax=Parvibaculum sp. TaxID=2024848 RepID=UPI0027167902|nr:hypothetical protein [Parvibaculum sp.]MDO8838866.1 hypothetical protein [Parvibaculum sp.]